MMMTMNVLSDGRLDGWMEGDDDGLYVCLDGRMGKWM